MLNLIIEGDDDDGEEAQKQATKKQAIQKPQSPQPQKPAEKTEFTQKNFEDYKQFCKWKVMNEIMAMAAEIKAKYTITEAMADQLNLFLKSL